MLLSCSPFAGDKTLKNHSPVNKDVSLEQVLRYMHDGMQPACEQGGSQTLPIFSATFFLPLRETVLEKKIRKKRKGEPVREEEEG